MRRPSAPARPGRPGFAREFASLHWRGLIAAGLVALVCVGPAAAQDISISLGEDGSLTGVTLQLLLAITLLSLVPGLAIMVTCFPFIVTVLSILRMAIGLQQSPPNMLIVTLALFLTYFVMDPVLTEAWQVGLRPLLDEEIDLPTAFDRTMDPFRLFMAARVDPQTFATLQGLRPDTITEGGTTPEAALSVLVPSFLLSEIERAFEIGFLIFIPFLIIDLVVAAILMSMGMMMVPPALVSLPFKLAFFVVADGWSLVSEALVRGYLG
ncbi:MAG: flagellar type III secretion system pore protein FliP [Pseudomonadota bacterium]